MPDIGQLDRRVRFDRCETSQDRTGGETSQGAVPICTVWARRRDVADGEQFAGGELSGFVRARFVVFSSEKTRSVTTKDLIWHDNQYWEIKGRKETADGRRNFLEFTAVVRTDDGASNENIS